MIERSGHLFRTSIGNCFIDLRGYGKSVFLVSLGAAAGILGAEPLASGLSRYFTVVSIGLPEVSELETPLDVPNLADAVFEVVDHLEAGTCAVFGHHVSALVAGELARAHPDRVDRLVLSGTPYWTPEEKLPYFHTLPLPREEESLDAYLLRLGSASDSYRTTRDELRGTVADLAWSVLQYDVRSRFPDIQARTLVLNSLSDPLGRWLFELSTLIPNAEPAMVADGSLFGQLDAETLVANLSEFLS